MQKEITNFILSDHYSSSQPSLEFILPALNEFKKSKLSIPSSNKLIKSIRAATEALKEYDETRTQILISLCDKDENENPIIKNNEYQLSSEEQQKEWGTKWTELLNTKIQLDIFPLTQKEISHLKEINVACYDTLLKYGYIESEKPEEKKEADK